MAGLRSVCVGGCRGQVPSEIFFLFRMLGLIRGLCTTLSVELPYFDLMAAYAQKGAILHWHEKASRTQHHEEEEQEDHQRHAYEAGHCRPLTPPLASHCLWPVVCGLLGWFRSVPASWCACPGARPAPWRSRCASCWSGCCTRDRRSACR